MCSICSKRKFLNQKEEEIEEDKEKKKEERKVRKMEEIRGKRIEDCVGEDKEWEKIKQEKQKMN